jgi:hypothetical protein
MALPGKTEAGSAGKQPCRGIARRAHRDDDHGRGNELLAPTLNPIGSKDPDALKIPARRAASTLARSAHSPVPAEPAQSGCNHPKGRLLSKTLANRSNSVCMAESICTVWSHVVIRRPVVWKIRGCSFSSGVVSARPPPPRSRRSRPHSARLTRTSPTYRSSQTTLNEYACLPVRVAGT